MVLGIVLLLIGAAWNFAPGWFGWVGKLPGDFRIHKGNTTILIPLGTMLVISLVLNVLYTLFFRR